MRVSAVQNRYERARDAALQRLLDSLVPERIRCLGARLSQDGCCISLPCLCWEFQLCLRPYSFSVTRSPGPVGVVWQVLALDYLAAPQPHPPRRFLSLADFAEGRNYTRAFEPRVSGRLGRGVGATLESFVNAARRLGVEPSGTNPVQCIFKFFPLFELQVIRHEGDSDFPPSCSVLLSDNALGLFSMEDAIVAAERLVSALEGKGPVASLGGSVA